MHHFKRLFIVHLVCALNLLLMAGCSDETLTYPTVTVDGMSDRSEDGAAAQTDRFAEDDAVTQTDRGAPDTSRGPSGQDTDEPRTTLPGPVEGPGGPTDLACLDGQYNEPLPTPDANIDAAKAAYSPGAVNDFIFSVLETRYPIGHHLVTEALENSTMGDCIAFFLYDTSTAQSVIGSMSTVVHECGHFLDMGLSGFSDEVFVITDELTLSCTGGNKFQYGGNTFVRAELMNDTFASLYPSCPPGQYAGCDMYADTYLTGSSGDQGFNMLIEEVVQYVNSLATGYAFADQYVYSVSERDGILTFLWYMQRYLYLARTQYPDTYEFLLNDSCYRELILTSWGRAWLYLGLTDDNPKLGLDDDALEALVMDPALLAEIESVRQAQGCP